MPIVFRYKSFRFFFYSNEGHPREPVHIHVREGRNEAKFWLHTHVQLAHSHGVDPRQLRELAQVIDQHREDIERAWHEHFGDA